MAVRLSATSTRAKLLVSVSAAGAIALVASAAWAVIPDSSGTIHGCITQDRYLRVIDTDAGQRCRRSERPLDWASAPAEALPDSFVAIATEDVPVPTVDQGRTVIASLTLPPGRYQVTGKVLLTSQSEQIAEGAMVSCQLTPSLEDGTPGNPGAPPADPGALVLAQPTEPGSAGTLTLGVSQVLAQSGSVVLDCVSDQDQLAAAPVASNAWIRAIEVGSIQPGELTPSP